MVSPSKRFCMMASSTRALACLQIVEHNRTEESMEFRIRLLVCATCVVGSLTFAAGASAQGMSTEELTRIKNAIDAQIYQENAAQSMEKTKAETRKAIAEAEKAEALATIPPTDAKGMTGAIDADKFGPVAQFEALQLAQSIAVALCKELGTVRSDSGRKYLIYDPATIKGILNARTIVGGIRTYQQKVENTIGSLKRLVPPSRRPPATGEFELFMTPGLALGVATGTVRAAADLVALFKSNYKLGSTAFGEGTRALFATALVESCPQRVDQFGSGYLGELDGSSFYGLQNEVTNLINARVDLANAISDKKAKKIESPVIGEAEVILKEVDTFISSLKPGDLTDSSPVYVAARYLKLEQETRDHLVLDYDLQLDGLTVIKDTTFSLGQKLRLSAVARLWYRVYEPDGKIVVAATRGYTRALREVSFRGQEVEGYFKDTVPPFIGAPAP